MHTRLRKTLAIPLSRIFEATKLWGSSQPSTELSNANTLLALADQEPSKSLDGVSTTPLKSPALKQIFM